MSSTTLESPLTDANMDAELHQTPQPDEVPGETIFAV